MQHIDKTNHDQSQPEVDLQVRGGRSGPTCNQNPRSMLVALDGATGKPITAQWHYEGGPTGNTTGPRFFDTYPGRVLVVSVGSKVVRLQPHNVAGNGYMTTAVRLDNGRVVTWGIIPPPRLRCCS